MAAPAEHTVGNIGLVSYEQFKDQVMSIVGDPGLEPLYDSRMRQAIRWIERHFNFEYMRVETPHVSDFPAADVRFLRAGEQGLNLNTGRIFFDVGGPIKQLLSAFMLPLQTNGVVTGDPIRGNPAAQSYTRKRLKIIPADRINAKIYASKLDSPLNYPDYICQIHPVVYRYKAQGDPQGYVSDRWVRINQFLIFPMTHPDAYLPSNAICGYTWAYRYSSLDFPWLYTPEWNYLGNGVQWNQGVVAHYPLPLEEINRMPVPSYPIGIPAIDAWNQHWLFDHCGALLEARIVATMVPAAREPDLVALYRDIIVSEFQSLSVTMLNQDMEQTDERMQYSGTQDVDLFTNEGDYPDGG